MTRHVLIITPSIKPGGGPPGYVHNLMKGIEELSEAGELKNLYEFCGEISTDRNKATGEMRAVRSFQLTIIKFLTRAGLKPLLSKKIRDAKKKIDRADLVIFQGFQEVYLAKYARRAGKRLCYMPHSPSVMADEYMMLCELNKLQFNRNHYKKLLADEASLIDESNFVIFPSKGASNSYIERFNSTLSRKSVIYIKSGVNIDCDSTNFGPTVKKKETIRILFAGRYVSHKGYDLFCDAAELIGDSVGAIEFATLGDGPMKQVYRHVTDLGWRNDVFSVLETADIIAVPNRIAYYDLLPLECAAIGKPLVMTNVGGNVDQMHDLPDSLSCDSATPEKLAESIKAAIKKLMSDPTWGIKNKIAFKSTFTVRKFAERWDSEVENMVSSN